MDAKTTVRRAFENGLVVPAFNVPYPPMLKPIAQAIADEDSVAMIQVARLEWEKFQSVMVDASRLDLQGNIAATKAVADIAHAAGIPVEAELGAVMGHETSQATIPYDEIFEKKLGFTEVADARQFVEGSGCDWLSVAVGSVHGAIADNLKDQKKPAARLDIDRIAELRAALDIPLVLHGGSGIENEYITRGIRAGIAKINVGTELRQPYERAMRERNDTEYAREQVYIRCRELIRDFLHTAGDAKILG